MFALQISTNFLKIDNLDGELEKFKNYVDEKNFVKLNCNHIQDKNQRKVNGKTKEGLEYGTVLYQKLLDYIIAKKSIKFNVFNPDDSEIYKMVDYIYSNNHISSFNALKKFIEDFHDTIIRDIQGKYL